MKYCKLKVTKKNELKILEDHLSNAHIERLQQSMILKIKGAQIRARTKFIGRKRNTSYFCTDKLRDQPFT